MSHRAMISYWLLLYFAALGIAEEDSRTPEEKCSLPWAGKWYKNDRLEPLQVNDTWMDTFGECIAENKEKERFLFRLKKSGIVCYRCLAIFAVHQNVLRFKQTGCIRGEFNTRDGVDQICTKYFRGDAVMSTLFRADATPEECPFEVPLNFTYKMIDGSCKSRTSSIRSCADPRRLRFQYQACPELSEREAHADDIECIGSWTSFSTDYLAIRIAKTDTPTQSVPYRCVILDKSGSGGKMGISADASCSELTSVTAASTVLLYKPDSRVTARCHFPSYLIHDQHLNNERNWVSIADGNVHHFRKEVWIEEKDGKNYSTALCLEHEDLGRTFKALLYVTQDCVSGYQCTKFIKRKNNIVEIIRGAILDEELFACDEVDEEHVETLLLNDSEEEKCPVKGKHVSQDCAMATIHLGCNGHQSIEFKPSCDTNLTQSLVCRGHWVEDEVKYVIAEDKKTHEKHCLIYSTLPDATARIRSYRHTACRPQTLDIAFIYDFNGSKIEDCNPVNMAMSGGPSISATVLFAVILLFLLPLRLC